jgi:TonB family protein
MTARAFAVILLFGGSLMLAQETPSSTAGHDETVPSAATTATHRLRVLRRVLPAYPKEARKAGIEGPVVLSAIIADDGTLVALEVVSGDSVLASAAMEAARQWQFEKPPPQLQG